MVTIWQRAKYEPRWSGQSPRYTIRPVCLAHLAESFWVLNSICLYHLELETVNMLHNLPEQNTGKWVEQGRMP